MTVISLLLLPVFGFLIVAFALYRRHPARLIMVVLCVVASLMWMADTPSALDIEMRVNLRGPMSAVSAGIVGFCGLWSLYLPARPPRAASEPKRRPALVSDDSLFAPAPTTDGPGRFALYGVDRETAMDTRIVIDADSADNAKVKAELRGVLVTRIERIG